MARIEQGPKRTPDRRVTEIWPSPFGSTAPMQSNGNTEGDDVEVHGIKCRQCGYPIKDRRIVTECPFCNSDNFDGAALQRY